MHVSLLHFMHSPTLMGEYVNAIVMYVYVCVCASREMSQMCCGRTVGCVLSTYSFSAEVTP